MKQPPLDGTHERTEPTVLYVIFRSLFFPAAGVALAFWIIHAAYLPRVGLGTVERIAELGRHLGQPFDGDVVACLGNSIVMEGIDASIVERTAGGRWQVENLATTGAGPTEFQILLPRLLKARPRV